MELSKNDVVVIKQVLNLEPAEFIEAIKNKEGKKWQTVNLAFSV